MTDKVNPHLDRFVYLFVPPVVGLAFGIVANRVVGDEWFTLMTNRVQCAGDFAIRLVDVIFELTAGEGDRARQERGDLTTIEPQVKKFFESVVIAGAEAVGDAKTDNTRTNRQYIQAVWESVKRGEVMAGLTTAGVLAGADFLTANTLTAWSSLPPPSASASKVGEL